MRSLDQLDVRGKRVLVRVDFNVPLAEDEEGRLKVADERASSPLSRRSRSSATRGPARDCLAPRAPKGLSRSQAVAAPVVARLSELLDTQVTLAPAVVGEQVIPSPSSCRREIACAREPSLRARRDRQRRAIRAIAGRPRGRHVDDAFGCAHRAHAAQPAWLACCLAPRGGCCSGRSTRSGTSWRTPPGRSWPCLEARRSPTRSS